MLWFILVGIYDIIVPINFDCSQDLYLDMYNDVWVLKNHLKYIKLLETLNFLRLSDT